ncbi:response regulator [Pantoea sp. Ap-967]|uniref:ATP-binding protein n=1 Tax=Pantoea sp. Ap-967 TaxID=2608362 RepID=UPI00141E43E7|nr:ATP-binding protein [Pantoea sp. Ap-967]NIE78384.1 response regulator [Pantoea sp. Ap-967]
MVRDDSLNTLTRDELIAEVMRLRALAPPPSVEQAPASLGYFDFIAPGAADSRLQERLELFRTILNTIEAAFAIVEVKFDEEDRPVDYRFLDANPAFARESGIDLKGKWVTEYAPDLEPFWFEIYGHVAKSGEPANFESYATTFDRWFDVRAVKVGRQDERQIAIFFNDVTERRTVAQERDRATAALQVLNDTLEKRVDERTQALMQAEEKLRQAHKMEAVGQLTGGLAHDFNNLLTGISGSLEMIQARLAQGRLADIERYMDAAQGAARRAASLTHRLLAFSRRQTLDPRPTDVNVLMDGMTELIGRTVGPEIKLQTLCGQGLWPALVDAGQLENALLNLCINARDAMPEGGRITLETSNRGMDQDAAAALEMPLGEYLCLSVSDTGTGMSAEVMAKAFDPFFTTKPLGQGTGLGLSMIYGFAKQSGGQVRMQSELGLGTTISLYLPRYHGDLLQGEERNAAEAVTGSPGSEAILIVDDEPSVRMLLNDALAGLGYGLMEAADSLAAMQILRSGVKIDLLITDVGLPGGMNGRQLADAGRELRPGLRTLFITGYAVNAAIGHGHLPAGMRVLTKPFALEALVGQVREMLAG